MKYTIRQGDHLSSLAAKWGFADFKTIWEHPGNADLRGIRKNPHVLYPGDKLFVPDKESRIEDAATDQTHTYRVKRPKLYLRIETTGLIGETMVEKPCQVHVGATIYDLMTDDQGVAHAEIPATVTDVVFIIDAVSRRLSIGHLDPADELPGLRERLRNLGYYDVQPLDQDDTPELLAAVRHFQSDHDLPVTGECDAATRQELLESHGS